MQRKKVIDIDSACVTRFMAKSVLPFLAIATSTLNLYIGDNLNHLKSLFPKETSIMEQYKADVKKIHENATLEIPHGERYGYEPNNSDKQLGLDTNLDNIVLKTPDNILTDVETETKNVDKTKPDYKLKIDSHLEHLVDKKINVWFNKVIDEKTGRRMIDNVRDWLTDLSYFREYIKESAEKNNLDYNTLIALYTAESRGDSRAYSPTKAAGIAQLTKKNARAHGLKINKIIDQRLEPELALPIGMIYAKYAFEKWGKSGYGFLPTADYNKGCPLVNGLIKKHGLSEDLFSKLPDETQKHYIRIAAIFKLLENPDKYDFGYEETKSTFKELIFDSDTYTIEKGEYLWSIARKVDTNPELLKKMNPSIIKFDHVTPGTEIRVPKNDNELLMVSNAYN